MSIGETLARINRIERILGIQEVKLDPVDIKAYRTETGCSLSYAHDVILKHEIARLFQEESK